MVIRYGEISSVAAGVAAGANIKRGQVIAYVGELIFKNGSKMSMLHLETYKGISTGPLTARGAAPYQRRSDLFNPTKLLDAATLN
jgi:murein DD-endopeptidase MepM/ murein hydrolase activator NlpD